MWSGLSGQVEGLGGAGCHGSYREAKSIKGESSASGSLSDGNLGPNGTNTFSDPVIPCQGWDIGLMIILFMLALDVIWAWLPIATCRIEPQRGWPLTLQFVKGNASAPLIQPIALPSPLTWFLEALNPSIIIPDDPTCPLLEANNNITWRCW